MDDNVQLINIAKLSPSPYNPFKKYNQEQLRDLTYSIRVHGIINPIVVRFVGEDNFEIISGHNRVEAAKIIRLKHIPATIVELDDDKAILMMIELNFKQRHDLKVSEKARAYKLKLEVLRKQGKRTDLLFRDKRTLRQIDKSKYSAVIAGRELGDSARAVQRYVRLCKLNEDLLRMIDDGDLPKATGENLTYLSPQNQTDIYNLIQNHGDEYHLTFLNTKELKEMHKEKDFDDVNTDLTIGEIKNVLSKNNQNSNVAISMEFLNKVFEKNNYSDKEMLETVIKALEAYKDNI